MDIDAELTTTLSTVKKLLATDAIDPDVRLAFNTLVYASENLHRPVVAQLILNPDPIPPYPLENLAEDIRQLLLKAERAGQTVDDIGETIEDLLAADWEKPIVQPAGPFTPAPVPTFPAAPAPETVLLPAEPKAEGT